MHDILKSEIFISDSHCVNILYHYECIILIIISHIGENYFYGRQKMFLTLVLILLFRNDPNLYGWFTSIIEFLTPAGLWVVPLDLNCVMGMANICYAWTWCKDPKWQKNCNYFLWTDQK